MPCFGGLTPFPKRFGGGRPRAKAILDSLNAGRGTGLDTTSWSSPVYGENVVAARAIAAAWSTNQRLANIWDSRRIVGRTIARWEKIRAITPNYGDSDNQRRARLAAIEALAGANPTHAFLAALLSNALGDVFVSIDYISANNAVIQVPDASYPFGVPSMSTSPWSSTIAHILVRVQKPAGMTEGEFYDTAGTAIAILDPVVPAWATIDWYRPGPVSVMVIGGPSAGGFYLDDEHNLDNEVFDIAEPSIASATPTTLTTGGGTVSLRGYDLSSTTGVTYDGGACAFTAVSNNVLTVVIPSHIAGPFDIVVTTPYGTATLSYTLTQASLTVTLLTPNTGPQAGGTAVVVTGTGFYTATDVTIFFSLAVWSIVDDNTINCTTDAIAESGTYDLVVTDGVSTPSLPFTFT